MAKGQVSVSAVGKMAEVLEEAKKTFDETETDSEAYKRALMDWYRNRSKDSKRGSLNRIEQNDAYLISVVTQMDARIAAMEMNLLDVLRVVKS